MNTKKNISFKAIFTVFGIFVAGLTALRLYQLFAITEADGTGFFKRTNPSVYALYIAVALGIIVLLALINFTNKVTASKPVRGKNKPLAIGSLLMAIGMGVDVAVSIATLIMTVSGYTARSGLLSYLFTNGYLAMGFSALFGLFSCIYFMLYALSYYNGRATFGEYRLLAIMPLFWAMTRIVRRFMSKISFTVVTDLFLELIMLAFMMMFFISFARISSQICQKNEMRKAMSYGLASAMFAAFISLSRLVVTVGGRQELLPAELKFCAADLAFAVFAVIFVYACANSGRDASEDDMLSDDETLEEEPEIDEDFLNEE